MTDIACLYIRRKRITREQAKEYIIKYDGKFPSKYLNKPLEEILKPLDLPWKNLRNAVINLLIKIYLKKIS